MRLTILALAAFLILAPTIGADPITSVLVFGTGNTYTVTGGDAHTGTWASAGNGTLTMTPDTLGEGCDCWAWYIQAHQSLSFPWNWEGAAQWQSSGTEYWLDWDFR